MLLPFLQVSALVEAVLLLHILWCGWVLMGWTVTRRRPVLAVRTHRFAYLRHRRRVSSLAAMPAHLGGDVA